LDCWTISASFAFTRLVISRLSPVSGMFPPYEIDIERGALICLAISALLGSCGTYTGGC
jgi:hypothetical protein